MKRDPALDLFRDRDDFRLLMLARTFPTKPFARTDASANWPAVQAGMQLCNAACSSRANTNNFSGNYWMRGGAADTLVNTGRLQAPR
jgi:hypothetical protein